MPIIVVTGKEIEKIKGDFESYLNGLNVVGEISYSQYSELYDEGTKQIQKAYELGKSELEKENAELKEKWLQATDEGTSWAHLKSLERENAKLKGELTKAKEIIKKFSEFVNNEIEYDPEHPQEHTDLWNKLCAEAEQFLNCSEKPNN